MSTSRPCHHPTSTPITVSDVPSGIEELVNDGSGLDVLCGSSGVQRCQQLQRHGDSDAHKVDEKYTTPVAAWHALFARSAWQGNPLSNLNERNPLRSICDQRARRNVILVPPPPPPLHPPSIAACPLHQLAGTEGVALSLSLTMSGSAPPSSSASSSTAPPAASAASTPFIAYELRDCQRRLRIARGCTAESDPALRIDKLRQAVFAAARARLPERYDYLGLDVYPPGSSDVDLSVQRSRCSAS